MFQKIAQKCGIAAMPTFQVFLNATKIDELVGASKDKLKDMIEKYKFKINYVLCKFFY